MEADQSSETEPIFTINDFPTVIVERFAPDLRPRTVSNLRLVSPRFRDVFTSDLYYRSYLCYENRPEFYREDLEEIGESRDRWWRCLEAEKRRLDNWRRGRPTRVETVQIPSNERSCFTGWHGTVGVGNNFLLMCELNNRKILLANVTKDPIMTVVDVSSYTRKHCKFAHLLADQVVIKKYNGLNQVFSILYEEGKHALKHVFTIETPLFFPQKELYISGFSDRTQSYRNFYVSHSGVGILRVWDLKRDALPDNLVLKELLPPNHASKLGNCYVILPQVFGRTTEFPYVLVKIDNRRTLNSLYLAVNVEEKRVAFCVTCEASKRLIRWVVKGREFVMEFCNEVEPERDIRIYGLPPRSQPCSEPQLLFRETSQDRSSPYEPLLYEPPWLIGCEMFKNKIILRHVDESSTQLLCYSIEMLLRAAMGPFFIVSSYGIFRSYEKHLSPSMYSRKRFSRLITLDKAVGTLFDWSEMLAANGAIVEGDTASSICIPSPQCVHELCSRCTMSPLFHSLSKSVVHNQDGNTLYICHF